LFEALEKLKEELMLMGFMSLLLVVFQGRIINLCMPKKWDTIMLPCKYDPLARTYGNYDYGNTYRRKLLAAAVEQVGELVNIGSHRKLLDPLHMRRLAPAAKKCPTVSTAGLLQFAGRYVGARENYLSTQPHTR